jgi:hypothetical protein
MNDKEVVVLGTALKFENGCIHSFGTVGQKIEWMRTRAGSKAVRRESCVVGARLCENNITEWWRALASAGVLPGIRTRDYRASSLSRFVRWT